MNGRSALLVLGAALALGACASVPRSVPVSGAGTVDFSGIPSGALVYAVVDVAAARPILDQALAGTAWQERLAPGLDRTDRAAGAWYGTGQGQRFFAAASGRYPVFRSVFSLSLDRDWKRRTDAAGQAYWQSRSSGYALRLSSRRVLVSDGVPASSSPGPEVPDAFAGMAPDAAIAGWTESAAESAAVLLGLSPGAVRVPAELLLFGVYPAGREHYRVRLRLETGTELQGRMLLTLFTVGARLFGRGAPEDPGPEAALLRALLAGPPLLDGTALVVESEPVSATDIALLLGSRLVYWKK